MSTRDAMGFPANPAVGDFYEGWEWDGEKWVAVDSEIHANIEDGTTDGQITTWAVDKWSPNNAVTVGATGNVGINVEDPKDTLHVQGDSLRLQNSGASTIRIVDNADGFCESQISSVSEGTNRSALIFSTRGGVSGVLPRMTIDANGDATFSGNAFFGNAAAVYGQFGDDMVLGASNCKAVIPITNGQADLGGASNSWKDGFFSGAVNADELRSFRWLRTDTGHGLAINSNGAVYPSGPLGETNLGTAAVNFKDAYFSGTVNAAGFTVNGSPISGGGSSDPLRLKIGGIGIGSADQAISSEYETESIIEMASAEMHGGFPNHTGVRISCAMPSGWGTQEVLFNLGSNWGVYNSTPALKIANSGVTANDFIATSDERVKDNITTAPVGLIDSLKGREWDWKESGEKGSGVVAQELEAVLPHLVHTDDEGMKSVAYNGLVAYLIEEVKALKEEIKEMKA